MKRVGYLIATLTIFTNAFAQESKAPVPTTNCSGFTLFLGVGLINDGINTAVTCEQVKPLERVYAEVSKLSPIDLPMPLLVVQNSVLPQLEMYSLLTRVFDVGVDVTSEAQMKAMPKLFAHEIGHHIFYANAYKNLVEYKDIAEITGLYSSAMLEERKDSDTVLGSDSFLSFVDMLNYFSLDAAADMVNFDVMGDSYQELFADVVAAVYLEDPEAMKNSMADFNFKTGANRTFSEDLPITAASASEPYYQFISLRGTLWKEWVKPRLGETPTVETKKKVIGDLLQIFISEIRRRVNDKGAERLLPPQIATEEEQISTNKLVVSGLLQALGLPSQKL